MARLLLLTGILGLTVSLFSQSPHGADFKVNCASCHTSAGWEIPLKAWEFNERSEVKRSPMTGWVIGQDTLRFRHSNTDFPLTGQHARVDCRACHESMVFSEAKTQCISCHTDMHQMTVGTDCARCHTTQNWLVDNVSELHQDNGFPLVGSHALATCTDCHKSESGLRFDRIGNDCISCHQSDYVATTQPNHSNAGFSSNCSECHDITRFDWHTDKVNHDFFPLEKGHEITDCASCHTTGSYSNTPSDCISCHTTDYQSTVNPSHQSAGFSQNCVECHTTDVNWMPAKYVEHDGQYFPIYSGKHQGEWDQCADCHTNASNFAEFTCTTCHVNPETNEAHNGISGYTYNSTACLVCHPNGSADDAFDHNNTQFPLTGVHQTTDCIACHASGYAGTPTNCSSCHTPDYNQSINPNHTALGMSTDCASCHTTTGWEPASFDDHNTVYPLNGAHGAIANDCNACHNGDYNNTPNTCSGCHTPDFNQTTNPNHVAGQFPTDCATCHSETAWVPSNFDHNTVYPLTGAHAAIASDCDACHHGNFNNTPNTCEGCHTPDYNQSTNPNHTALGIPTDCATCHTNTGWEPASFSIHNNYYPLNGAHAAVANECATCHNGDYNNTPNTCAGCHTPDYNQTTNPNHVTAQFPTDCATCHSETAWAPSSFDHNSIYPLNGAHAAVANDCNACHAAGYTNTPNTCAGCHTPDYNQTTNPNHVAAQFPTDCATCHSETAWAPSSFDHNSIYPLNGAHAAVAQDCNACHAAGYTNTPNTCAGCHTPDYNQTTNPNHVAAQFSSDCATCHSETAWAPSSFDHNSIHPLNGAHAVVAQDCNACHAAGYTNTPNTCAGCHTPDYNQTTNPNHVAAQFSTDCATCHSETAWTPSSLDHNSFYPLNGAHAVIANDCNACHNGNYNNTPNTCAGCHTSDYNQTTNPNHVAAQFPMECATCHSETAWVPSSFNHNSFYPLNGAHAVIANDCNACHNGNYTNTPNTCAGCHTPDYNQTTNPNHVAAQFPMECATCHSETAWVPSSFDHNSIYPLTGAHAAIASDCNACHNGNYTNTPNTCAGCHTPDYNQSTNPNHSALGIPTDCATCHTNTGWEPATFPIHNNYYSLNGAHAAIANDCATCHNGDYNNTPNTCAGCHTPEYNQTTNPNHVTQQFPTDCATCHSETAWAPSSLDHNSFYPLTGAHAAIANDCNTCHNGNYNNTPNTCAGCHTPDYNQSTNPNHTALGIPTDCATCHTNIGWEPASFPIHNTYYPLNGAHGVIANDCVACHNGNYNNTPNTCTGCHIADYNQTTNPNHVAQQFPTDCASCHSETAWVPSTLDHNIFYPLTGAHAAIASDCNACHNGNYNNTPNTCAGCHTPDYNQSTNPNHTALAIPNDCANCHTDIGWEPAEFPIHNNYYQLNGAHAAIANNCIACHNGNYNSTPNTCVGCHLPDYNQTNNPNHASAQFPTTCQDCHSETAWEPSTFDHDGMYFPIYSGSHEGEWNQCSECHTTSGNYSIFNCLNCHTNPGTNNDHQGVNGYAYNSPACYACHPNGDD
ncbi:MAG: hypothetical protein IT270_01130 [Saprospiraceae bacterium]|nr:hypothetical protein [Saprospiraceae bacterium]